MISLVGGSWLGERPAVLRRRTGFTLVALEQPPADGSVELRATGSAGHLWDDRELWALEDSVPRYSIDSGRFVLWDRMVLDVPELAGRSAEELRNCWLDPPMPLQKGMLEHASVQRPPRLEQWEQLEDGSVRGVLYGADGIRDGCVRATVEPSTTGSLAEVERWCIHTRGGNVFQLGLEAVTDAGDSPDGEKSTLNALVDATSKAGQAALPTVTAAAATAAAPAAIAAILVGGALIASGGHLHIPHIDVSVFVV